MATEAEVLASLTAGWIAAVKALWLARHSDAYELIGLKAFRAFGAAKLPAFVAVGEAGGVTGTPVLSFASRVITLYTESENYRRRGRVQLSGGESAMFDEVDGSVDATELGLVQILGDELIVTLQPAGGDFQLCLPPTAQLPFEDIVGVLARPTPGVIRSRRVKRFYIG